MEPKITKHIYKRKRMPRNEIIARLIERDGNHCPICGIELQPSNCTIDHILPTMYRNITITKCKHTKPTREAIDKSL